MIEYRILTARRAYDFRPDELRLTVLSVAEVHQLVQRFFSFQVVQVAPPMPTFGPIPNTLPPGIVFDYGTTQTPDESPTPIRFMHFEPQRIVIDVAGPSSAIDWTFKQLRNLLAKTQAPDGTPAIGVPEKMHDYSEISVRCNFGFDDLVDGPLLELAQETFGEDGRAVLPLSIKFRATDPSEKVFPANIGNINTSQGQLFEFRAGTRPEEGAFYSATELPTDQHRAWFEALDQRLSG